MPRASRMNSRRPVRGVSTTIVDTLIQLLVPQRTRTSWVEFALRFGTAVSTDGTNASLRRRSGGHIHITETYAVNPYEDAVKESKKKAVSRVARNDAALPSDPGEIQTPASDAAAAKEQIRMRAYELYRERGGKVGDDMADWLRAEREYFERVPRTSADQEQSSAHAN